MDGTSSPRRTRMLYYYLQLGKIKGWSTDPGYVGWITLLGVEAGKDGTFESTWRLAFSKEIDCWRPMDGSTPDLHRFSYDEDKAPAKIEMADRNGGRVMTIEMKNAEVRSWGMTGSSDNPEERFTLKFTEARVVSYKLSAG